MDRSRVGGGASYIAALAVLGVSVLAAAPAQGPASPVAAPITAAADASHTRMLTILKDIAGATARRHPFLGDAPLTEQQARLAALTPATPDSERWLVLIDLAQAELRAGRVAESIEHLSQALPIVRRAGDAASMAPYTNTNLFHLGVAYMRLGETENCTLHNSATSCILPLRGDSLHTQQEPSRRAIATFKQGLENHPNDDLGLSFRWLMNLAYMTIGGYPDQVPAEYLIPPSAFESEEAFPRFANIAPGLGLDTVNNSGGAIADDFDNDGFIDLVVSSWDPRVSVRFYHNDGNGRFTDRSTAANLTGIAGGLNMVQADYNNDGATDILVLRGAWLGVQGQHLKSLLRNNGNGTFTDVTLAAGLGNARFPSQAGAWADYDNDGDLDLYIGNESSGAINAPSQLFRNNGDGTFTDVAAAAGVTNNRYAKAATWGDIDNDRWPDLYVSNRFERNRLYHNNGDGTFTDIAERVGVGGPTESFPAWFWDVDNDGALDLYVAAYAAGIEHLAASALKRPVNVELARLYRGDGAGHFTDVTTDYNLTRPTAPMGSNFGDLDNDGYLDFYLGTGYPAVHNLMPNVMYHNQGGTRFADISQAGGFAHLQKGHAVVFADFNHDGDLEVFEQMGGAYPVDPANNVFYENPGFRNHWLALGLHGRTSNRSAIGARIRADIVENGRKRTIYRHVNSGGSFGGNPLRQTLGLGKATRVDLLEISWPTTGRTQTFRNVAVDRLLDITEDEAAFTTPKLRPFAFVKK